MRFAFSTIAVPEWDLATAAARGREMDFEGLEVGAEAGGPIEGVEIACLAASVSMPAGRHERAVAAAAVRAQVDAARRMGCARVKLSDAPFAAGLSVQGTAVEMGRWLAPLADYAATAGVQLLVENGRSFRFASELWTLLESVGHPNVGVAWDLAAALAAGEGPGVSVPTLNTRIQYVRLRGAGLAPEAARPMLTRLMGVGYAGYVAVEAPADRLAAVLGQLREWTRPVGKPKKLGLMK